MEIVEERLPLPDRKFVALTTRSENGYKRSGVYTPNNVREFKRFATPVETSSEATRCVRINVHGKYPVNSTLSTV